MALGSITTAAAAGHGGGPPGEHTQTLQTASVYEWANNCPSPPTATADRGRRRDKSPNQKEIKKNRQSEEEGKKKAKSLNKMFY